MQTKTGKITEYQFQEMCSRLVQQEVRHTISNLVYTLACGMNDRIGDRDLSNLAEQAMELSAAIEDWQSAAEEAGWTKRDDGLFVNPEWTVEGDDGAADMDPHGYHDWADLCADKEIEPHQTEVYEHWIVSDWLAEKLKAEGERIEDDFAGLTVWARTTTGQAISMDHVIRQITIKLHDITETE